MTGLEKLADALNIDTTSTELGMVSIISRDIVNMETGKAVTVKAQ